MKRKWEETARGAALFNAYWEQFAARFADRMLTKRTRAEVALYTTDALYTAKQADDALGSWIAFLEGWGGLERCSVAQPPIIFEAGQLARRILDDRETTMTRIYEYLATARAWKTDREIQEALVVDHFQVRCLGRQLVAGGFVETKQVTPRNVVPARMAFRRVPPRRRS